MPDVDLVTSVGVKRQNNWLAWVVAAVAVIGLIIVVLEWFIGIGALQEQHAQLEKRVAVLEASMETVKIQNEKSISDRASLIKNVAALESKFCEEDNLRNTLTFKTDQFIGLLWESTFKSELPLGSEFYAHVCQSSSALSEAGKD